MSGVRFRGESGHPLPLDEFLLMTHLRHGRADVSAMRNPLSRLMIC